MRDVLRRVRARSEGAGDLDLVPVLNLVAMLVPLLLLTSRLGGLSVLAAEPATGGGGRSPDLRLEVALDGFVVLGDEDVAGDPGPLLCVPAPCPGADRWPYAALTGRLAEVKAARPDAHRIVVVADPAVPYDVLVRTMDAARTDLRDPATPRTLFPDVSVATEAER